MNQQSIIEDIFKEDGMLKKKNPFYKKRPSQIEAAKHILKGLNEQKHVIFQGPTGLGKSAAYTSGVMQYLVDNPRKRVLIVTSGLSLQEQLLHKDVPFMISVFDELYPQKRIKDFFRYTVLKGMNNYICKNKYEILSPMIDDGTLGKLETFLEETLTGDLAEITFKLDTKIKDLITTDREGCIGNRCRHKKECFVNIQKEKSKKCNIIITNYHMLFASLYAGSSLFDDVDVIIFDEAHEIVDTIRDHSERYINSNTVSFILKTLNELKKKDRFYCEGLQKLNIDDIKIKSDLFFNEIRKMYKTELEIKARLIESQSDLPDSEELGIALSRVITELVKVINKTQNNLVSKDVQQSIKGIVQESEVTNEELIENKKNEIIEVATSLKKICTEMIDLISNVDIILSDDNKVLWIENERNNVIKIGLKDIDVSGIFSSYFLEENGITCILTSATLSVDNNFNYIKEQLGFNKPKNKNKEVIEYIGETSFDLSKQELWYLPENAIPGNHPDFEDRMLSQIADILKASNGGALCLFTSMKSLKIASEKLPLYLCDQTILNQFDMSKTKILEVFKENVDSNLLATKSFFTGVDVSGESLRVLILDKLPFTSPGDPIQQVLNKRPGAFFKYSLPEMIILLRQAVGRGIRSVDDKCVICILDNRISTARYKGIIFNSFKYKKKSTRNLEDIKKFLGS